MLKNIAYPGLPPELFSGLLGVVFFRNPRRPWGAMQGIATLVVSSNYSRTIYDINFKFLKLKIPGYSLVRPLPAIWIWRCDITIHLRAQTNRWEFTKTNCLTCACKTIHLCVQTNMWGIHQTNYLTCAPRQIGGEFTKSNCLNKHVHVSLAGTKLISKFHEGDTV